MKSIILAMLLTGSAAAQIDCTTRSNQKACKDFHPPQVASVGWPAQNSEFPVTVDSMASGRVVQIKTSEYERLQKLRQAVEDAEVEIAKAHGVWIAPNQCRYGLCLSVYYQPSDRYEFRGQFLLVNVPPKETSK